MADDTSTTTAPDEQAQSDQAENDRARTDQAQQRQAQKKIANRLRRAQGQLSAVIDAVEGGDGCRDVVQQLSAVSKALDRAGFLVISTAMRECLTDPDAEDAASPEELEKLFLSLA